MADFITITSSKQRIVSRIEERLKTFDFSDRNNMEPIFRIALLLENQAKLNVRRQNIVDSGFLLNRIRSHVDADESSGVSTITTGPRGVKYAAMNEFGGPFTAPQRRAMFASLARTGKLNKGKSKNVIHGGRWRARPYLRPVIPQTAAKIRAILRESFGS